MLMRVIMSTWLLGVSVLIGCAPGASTPAPTLSFPALHQEVSSGHAVRLIISGQDATAELDRVPEEAAQQGLKGTRYSVTLPASARARANFVSLCSHQHVKVVQYR